MKARRFVAVVLCALLLLGVLPMERASAAPTFTTPMIHWVGCLSGTTLKVHWRASTGAEGIVYNVERSTGTSGIWTIVKDSTTLTEFTNYSLTAGTLYLYRVIAYLEINPGIWAQSPPSNVVGGIPLVKPSSLTITPVNTTTLRLSWTAVPHATGYQIFRGYYKTGPFSYIGSTTALTKQIFGHEPGTFYYYFVWGTKTIGSQTYQGAPKSGQGITFAIPAISSVKAVSATSTKIIWGAVTGATGYELWCRKGTTGSFVKVYAGTQKAFTNTGLTSGATYYYRVRPYKRVYTTNYYGMYSAVKSIKMP